MKSSNLKEHLTFGHYKEIFLSLCVDFSYSSQQETSAGVLNTKKYGWSFKNRIRKGNPAYLVPDNCHKSPFHSTSTWVRHFETSDTHSAHVRVILASGVKD